MSNTHEYWKIKISLPFQEFFGCLLVDIWQIYEDQQTLLVKIELGQFLVPNQRRLEENIMPYPQTRSVYMWLRRIVGDEDKRLVYLNELR